MDTYRNFAALAEVEIEGRDFEIQSRLCQHSRVLILAPHAGGIEPKTGKITEAIAGTEYSFYQFIGKKTDNNATLHITSTRFDEPRCEQMLRQHEWILSVHGCSGIGSRVLIGGRYQAAKDILLAEITAVGISALAAPNDLDARSADNICNRGTLLMGVQLELTKEVRQAKTSSHLVTAVRHAVTRILAIKN